MTDIPQLIDRLEKAEKGSQELDARIILALLAPSDAFLEQSKINGRWCIYDGYDRVSRPRLWDGAPRYPDDRGPSQSIDAAIALAESVLPGWAWWASKIDAGSIESTARLWVPGDRAESGEEGKEFFTQAKTPVLALCIAILKAVQAKGE